MRRSTEIPIHEKGLLMSKKKKFKEPSVYSSREPIPASALRNLKNILITQGGVKKAKVHRVTSEGEKFQRTICRRKQAKGQPGTPAGEKKSNNRQPPLASEFRGSPAEINLRKKFTKNQQVSNKDDFTP